MARNAAYLATLNEAQYRAVTHPPHIPLQMLAGPGSGKTHVLTCRIAYLVSQGIAPSRICAVTFTNKAANEMRERLVSLIGPADTSKLIMGTFHALCAKFLRQYGTCIGLSTNFTICDSEESKKIVNKLIKEHRTYLQDCDFDLTDKQVASLISKAKSKDLSPKQVARGGVNQDVLPDGAAPNPHHTALAMLFEEYQRVLKENRSLDFDDLLTQGVRLLDSTMRIAEFCEHVLVDEFQDTNVQQYKLMVRLAAHHKRVTIVGDPDQSIYGWRAAEIENLSKMLRDFDNVEQVLLEQNYRSTQSILRTSIAIMTEDKNRIPKSLYSAHYDGSVPTLRSCKDERDEGDFIAGEIKRLQAYTGGMLKFTDIAILLRTSAMSRAIEASLQREGIPHKVLKGHKFFERMEVKDLLAYLQLVDNPNFAPAFTRAINTPPRSMGDKTVAELLAVASARKCSPVDVVEGIFTGRIPDIKPPAKRKLAPFVAVYRQLRKDAEAGVAPNLLLSKLVELIDYEEHLKRTQDDWESRMENVQELVSFAGQARAADVDISLPGDAAQDSVQETPLRVFLQASMLSSDADGDAKEGEEKDEVIISTCHAAKGLEWPVVFIPAVENGIFPHKRTEDFDEERRLLYVACTRAKAVLYLTHCATRIQSPKCDLSPFIAAIAKRPMLVSSSTPTLQRNDVASLAQLLKRERPEEKARQAMITEYQRLYRPRPQANSTNVDASWTDTVPAYTGPVGFTTAQQVMASTGYSAPGRTSLQSNNYPQQWSNNTLPPAQVYKTSAEYHARPESRISAPSTTVASSASSSSASTSSKPASSSSTRSSTMKSSSSKTASASRPPSRTLHNYFSRAPGPDSKDPKDRVIDLTLDEPAPEAARPSKLAVTEPPRRPLSAANLPAPASQARPLSHGASVALPKPVKIAAQPQPSPNKTAVDPSAATAASRKRLGMGRTTGYVNKKFKGHHVSD